MDGVFFFWFFAVLSGENLTLNMSFYLTLLFCWLYCNYKMGDMDYLLVHVSLLRVAWITTSLDYPSFNTNESYFPVCREVGLRNCSRVIYELQTLQLERKSQ